ncbi:MAG: 16S rRNA (cytidine(1402)-2'-O)-methyltransferase [Deltaproteobacteria bacterium]|nr:16S rRNA (cytidine(1402)-2'-O)-methyltransferase [Deltaproteobacteria bacterium]
MGTLYIVATPIGNLEDITLRALRILRKVGLIAAEDTRHTRILLRNFHIHIPLTSYFEGNELKKGPYILSRLKEGMDVALVSDAGTPGISDPGYRLVRLAIDNSIPVVPIPGPSALMTALSVAGLPTNSFVFEGFVPSKQKERQKFLLKMKGEGRTIILYESPRRVIVTLEDIIKIWGDVGIVVARELTKIHEEVLRDKASVVLERLRSVGPKGEITIVLPPIEGKGVELPLEEHIRQYLKEFSLPMKDVVRVVAEDKGISKKEVYKLALQIKKEGR